MLVIPGISVPFPKGRAEAEELARRRLKLPRSLVQSVRILKESVDCRRKNDLRLVFTIGFVLKDETAEERFLSSASSASVRPEHPAPLVFFHGKGHGLRPVVVGLGPAGLFAALVLARNGYAPIVLERGGSVDERVEAVQTFFGGGSLDVNTNIQFGEGGAGTFSDGKLTTRINDPYCSYVLEQFAAFGAPREILTEAKPHIGTDLLRAVVREIRREVVRLGGEVRFHTKFEELMVRSGRIIGIKTDRGDEAADGVILAIGHSARDTFFALRRQGVPMCAKEFSVGVRIEHLQSSVNQALYGKFADDPRLQPASYQHSWRRDDRGVYTFCMCPGGTVVAAASEENTVVTNGMSVFARDGANANSALVVNVGPADLGADLFAGIEFQRELERRAYGMSGSYKAPMQTVGNFLAGKGGGMFKTVKPTYPIGVVPGDLARLFPHVVVEYLQNGLRKFDRRQQGFAAPDALLTGPETRTSSPIRILRGENKMSEIEGLFPCGEGAGYAGGIMSAAVDGVRCAAAYMEQFGPPVQ